MCRISIYCVTAILLLALTNCSEAKQKCMDQVADETAECTSTEYNSYVECMRKRAKRDLGDCCSGNDCDGDDDASSFECGQCDCDYCSYNDCRSECSSCCQSSPPPCQSHSCCHRTCSSQCSTSRSCRRSCRSRCNKQVISGSAAGSSSSSNENRADIKNDAKHNITTIINLHNVINNTNVIDMPINVNNTNINNITLEAPITSELVSSGGSGRISETIREIIKEKSEPAPQDNCCKIVGPRQCQQISSYPYNKCFHFSKRHCGQICQTDIMHAEPHQICDQGGLEPVNCRQQVMYIPQPQPRCTYTSAWPYVQCGIQPSNCNGCYSHIPSGGPQPQGCASSCYGSGLDVGPSYPYFQPGFGQMPNPMFSGAFGSPGDQGYDSMSNSVLSDGQQ